jgi:hypothetical protein
MSSLVPVHLATVKGTKGFQSHVSAVRKLCAIMSLLFENLPASPRSLIGTFSLRYAHPYSGASHWHSAVNVVGSLKTDQR